MTDYYAQTQFGYSLAPCVSPFPHVDTETNHHCSAADNCLRRSSLREKEEEEEERQTTTAQYLPTISKRPSPSKVQPMMISHQQACAALLKLGKRPRSWRNPRSSELITSRRRLSLTINKSHCLANLTNPVDC